MIEKTLATFKIEVSQWELFKSKCADSDSNATQTILDLIAAYLDNKVSVEPKIGEETLAVIDKRVDAAISPLKSDLEALKAEIEIIKVDRALSLKRPSEDALQGVSKSMAVRSIVRNESTNVGLSGIQLAKRLNTNRSGLERNRDNSDKLAAYTSERDPDKVAWQFSDGRYFPVD